MSHKKEDSDVSFIPYLNMFSTLALEGLAQIVSKDPSPSISPTGYPPPQDYILNAVSVDEPKEELILTLKLAQGISLSEPLELPNHPIMHKF